MNICSCPVCGKNPTLWFNDKEFTIECPYCKENGFIIKVFGKTYEESLATWNNRALNTEILNNSQDFIYLLRLNAGDKLSAEEYKVATNIKDFEFFSNMFTFSSNSITGWLITPEGKLLYTTFSHEDELLKYAEINIKYKSILGVEDILNAAVLNGFIILTLYGKNLSITCNLAMLRTKSIKVLVSSLIYNHNLLEKIKQISLLTEKHFYNFNNIEEVMEFFSKIIK